MVGLNGVEGKVEAAGGADFVGSEGGVINVMKGAGRLCVRSPWKFANYLPFSVDLQVSETEEEGAGNWREVKKLSCGESLLWEGGGTEGLRLRVKFTDNLSQFPDWSTGVHVKERGEPARGFVKDESGVGLQLSFQCADGADGGEEAARIVSFYVPFWVIDSTGVRLEYQARAAKRNAPAAEVAGERVIVRGANGARSEGTKTATGARSLAAKRCEYCAFSTRRLLGSSLRSSSL